MAIPDETDQGSNKLDCSAVQARLLPIITSRLAGVTFERDQDRFQQLNDVIGKEVKALLLDHYPHGYKFVVFTQLVKNCSQAGRAGLVSHWDEQSDAVLTQIWNNDSVVFSLLAFLVRVAY